MLTDEDVRDAQRALEGLETQRATTEAALPRELTESSAAHLFAERNRGDLWYVPGRGWLVYRGADGCFHEDDDAALRAVQSTVASIREAAGGDKKALVFATSAASAHGLKAILSLAQIEESLRTSNDSFDRPKMAINLTNGIFDLRSGVLLPHDRRHRLTLQAGTEYNPEAQCPLWEKHLQTILQRDEALIAFLQRWAGRALSGVSPSDNCRILMPYGMGANGKTVTVETLSAVLGSYAAAPEFTTWCSGSENAAGGQRYDLVGLAGKRLVTSTESGYHHRLDEALLKLYTGGELVSPRAMYAKTASVYRPQFSLLLSTNHLPRLEGADRGFWRRFLKMGFEYELPEPDWDLALTERLRGELPGIFNWMYAGYQMWAVRGLDPPTSVMLETAEFKADIDLIGQFIDAHLTRYDGEEVELSAVYERYVTWCVTCGINRRLTVQQFSHRIVEHGMKRGHTQPGRRACIKGWVLSVGGAGPSSSSPSSGVDGERDSEFPF